MIQTRIEIIILSKNQAIPKMKNINKPHTVWYASILCYQVALSYNGIATDNCLVDVPRIVI